MLQSQDIQKVYIAYFNRPADSAGLAFWTAQVATGQASLSDIMAAFAGTAEYRQTFEGKSPAAIVTTVYKNLFGREAESEGLEYWTEALANGLATSAQFAYQVLDAAQNSDKSTIDNKAAAAQAFTDRLSSQNADPNYSTPDGLMTARSWLATIGHQPDSVDAAVRSLAAVIDDITGRYELPQGPAREFTVTLGWDGKFDPSKVNSVKIADFYADHDKIKVIVRPSNMEERTYEFVDNGTVYYRDLTVFGDNSGQDMKGAVFAALGDRGDGDYLKAGETVLFQVLDGGKVKSFLFIDDHGVIGEGKGWDNGPNSAVWHTDSDLWIEITNLVGLRIQPNGYMIENDLFA